MLKKLILCYSFFFIFFGLISSEFINYKNVENFFSCLNYDSYLKFVDSILFFSVSKKEEDLLILKNSLLSASPEADIL